MAAGAQALSLDHALASVVESGSLGGHFTRVVLDVPDVDRLSLPLDGDTAVGLYFGESLAAPGRTYTVRHDDRPNARLVVDILMHGEGVGTAWARGLSIGDKVVLAHANSWYRPPASTEWQVLVADMAGLPALARILDDPPPVPTTVIVDVVDDGDLAYLPQQHEVTLVALSGTGDGGSALRQQVAAHIGRGGGGYCWFAGEASDARAVRKHLRRELRWTPEQLDVMGYWRRDSPDWDNRFARVGVGLYSAYTAALADGKSGKDAFEEYDEALERAGL